tara:strand:- start:320 stop:442 length:123 start_codon:yes stop_codon:yes gene_type:complete
MSIEAYLKYLENIELSDSDKLLIINQLIELSERLFDEYYN